ncbi:MAG: hypothetical protein KF730_13105 [Sphingomonas sp.]|uniref:hypothetical protein n=1 Tax=Sphingomonas sp. TaxID=28214 RepID=UPI0025D12944|nr:hypothetical protein [Sphingomonas sp.]MBX3565501.1 hypothetical protein [Sphingomonas sp.]
MDLIERYLGAVRWNLPAGKTDDIIAELREVIESRIEDREAKLGRPLTQSEVSALLKEFGHPITVAGGYREQRALIGAEVFPFYWFVLRVVLAVVAVIEAIQIGGRIVGGQMPIQALSQGLHGAVASLLLNAAIVTLAFAIIERGGWLSDYLAKWKPESLPSLPRIEARPRKIGEPIMGIVFGLGFIAWWTGALPIHFWSPHDADAVVHAAPVWTKLYWPVIALVGARVVQDVASLLIPTWKLLRALLSLGCAAGTVAIAAVLYQAGRLVTVTAAGDHAEQAIRMQEGLDKALAIAVPVIAALSVWQCGVELWRLARERNR